MMDDIVDGKFIGYYASRPFWAIEAVDVIMAKKEKNLSRLCREIVFFRSRNGLSFGVCRDGLILLQQTELEEEAAKQRLGLSNAVFARQSGLDLHDPLRAWVPYQQYANISLLLLDHAVRKEHSTNHFSNYRTYNSYDIIRLIIENGVITTSKCHNCSMSHNYITFWDWFEQFDNKSGHCFDDLLYREGRIFNHNVFASVFETMLYVCNDQNLLKNLALLAEARSAFNGGDYETCILWSWLICEYAINVEWEKMLSANNIKWLDGSKRISSSRMSILEDGNTFTASVKCEMLELMGFFDSDTYVNLKKCRKIRNAIVHHKLGKKPDMESANISIQLAFMLATKNHNIDLSIVTDFGILML